jgi:polysaccharide biosynthesis protein PslJ
VITGPNGDTDFLETGLSDGSAGLLRKTGVVPLLTVYIYLLMFIPSALVLAPLGGAGNPATIFAAGLVFWYLLLWLHPGYALDRERQPIRGAAALFAGAILVSYVLAASRALPGAERNGADRGLILLAGWLGVLLLAADGIGTWERLQTVLRRVVIGGTIVAGIGITQFATGLNFSSYVTLPGFITKVPVVDLMIRGGLNRPSATTAQPLELAAVLMLCLPLALHQARFADRGTRVRRWCQAGVIGVAVPLTVSRAAVLGIVAMALILLPTWPKRHRRTAYLFLAGAVGLLWVVLPSLLSLLWQLFSQIGTESSSASRISAYSAAAPFIAQHPWFGQGFQTFFPQVYFFVDNQYLTSLIETGVAGLCALLVLFGAGWVLARRGRRATTGAGTRDLLQSLAAAVAAAAISFSTFDALSFEIASGLTFLVLGCVGAAWRLAGRP